MRKKPVVFHVGAHKTGTSLLQKFMRNNPELLKQHGIHYITRSEMNDFVGWGQHLLEHPERIKRRLRAAMRSSRTRYVITSHENTLGRPFREGAGRLYPDADELVDALGELLEPHKGRLFFYIRPQEEFLESYYLQRIHEGQHATFEEWLGNYDLDAVSWAPTIEHMWSVFGRDRVDVVDFRTIKAGQNEFIRSFFRRIDPALDIQVEYRSTHNPSISDKGLRIALAANPHLKKKQRKLMRVFMQKRFSNTRYPRPVLFSDEQKAWLRERYADENARLLSPAPLEAVASGEVG